MALTRGQRLVVVGLGGVMAGVALFVTVALIAGSGGVDLRLGDDIFDAGDAARLAELVEEGGPLLFSDAGGGDRDIYLQHLETNPEEGWIAFDARPRGTPRDCFLEWRRRERRFVAPCNGASFPADGGRLPRYRVVVLEEHVTVDLRRAVTR